MTATGTVPPAGVRGATITGWGTALPPTVVTNADYEARLDTNDAWITERTGIKERRHGGTTAGLAVEAGRAAMDMAGVTGADIDFVILATTSPDYQIPSTASEVQHELGIAGGAVDLNAACSGFVYGLVHAHGLIAMGLTRILLVGAETLSRLTDQEDRNTAILFGDGAGAVVLEASDEGQLLSFDMGSDGSARKFLDAPIGGYMQMVGKEVFRKAVTVMVDSARASMAKLYRAPEPEVLKPLLDRAALTPESRGRVLGHASGLLADLRAAQTKGWVNQFLQEYRLNSSEGVALLSLAEAFLRVPDPETADLLIADKLGDAD